MKRSSNYFSMRENPIHSQNFGVRWNEVYAPKKNDITENVSESFETLYVAKPEEYEDAVSEEVPESYSGPTLLALMLKSVFQFIGWSPRVSQAYQWKLRGMSCVHWHAQSGKFLHWRSYASMEIWKMLMLYLGLLWESQVQEMRRISKNSPLKVRGLHCYPSSPHMAGWWSFWIASLVNSSRDQVRVHAAVGESGLSGRLTSMFTGLFPGCNLERTQSRSHRPKDPWVTTLYYHFLRAENTIP